MTPLRGPYVGLLWKLVSLEPCTSTKSEVCNCKLIHINNQVVLDDGNRIIILWGDFKVQLASRLLSISFLCLHHDSVKTAFLFLCPIVPTADLFLCVYPLSPDEVACKHFSRTIGKRLTTLTHSIELFWIYTISLDAVCTCLLCNTQNSYQADLKSSHGSVQLACIVNDLKLGGL